jgi:hypothetical protein
MSIRLRNVVLLMLTVLPGCSDGPPLGTVSGKVSQGGHAIPFAYVVFQPVDPPGTYGSAYTDAEGRYVLQYSASRQGALVARHEVTIRTAARDEIQVEDRSTGLMVTPPLPDGYKEKVEVLFDREVKPGDNVIDFDLVEGRLKS